MIPKGNMNKEMCLNVLTLMSRQCKVLPVGYENGGLKLNADLGKIQLASLGMLAFQKWGLGFCIFSDSL